MIYHLHNKPVVYPCAMIRWMVLLICLLGSAVQAEPVAYILDPTGSRVTFTYTFMNGPASGTMAVSRADLMLDLQDLAQSTADVVLDITSTKTGNPVATKALAGPKILDAARYPQIRFTSKTVTGMINSASITGDVTLHGVTRPMVLHAQIYRSENSPAGDLSHLTVLMTGHINRSEFGADGYSDVVADRVDLKIIARLHRK